MLIQFSVGNYLSFKNIVTLSMVASSKKELEDSNTFFVDKKLKLLKSVAIYGANASGKTNIFKAMRFFRDFVLYSSRESQVTEKIKVSNFKLSSQTDNEPCFFEAIFIQDGIKYKYGFQVDKEIVHREWLFYFPKGKEAKLFTREKGIFDTGTHFKEGSGLSDKTRENALFLSVVAQFNGPISTAILKWFKKFRIISALGAIPYTSVAIEGLKNPIFKESVLNFLKAADLGIEGFNVEERKLNLEDLPEPVKNKMRPGSSVVDFKISTTHKKYADDNKFLAYEQFDLENEESDGTKKFFVLSGPILESLKNSYILAVDELDSRLHPLLVQFIIKLFNSGQSNFLNAQLIFASHGTGLLHRKLLRRDQVWFTEKDQYSATNLYSLLDYKVRKDASFEKDYMLGKYGATPYIGDFKQLPETDNEKQK